MNASTSKSNTHYRSLALVGLCLLTTTTTVWADPPATRSIAVSFRALDLSTESGVAKLYRHIQAAARSVCQCEGTSARERVVWLYCVRPAVDAAVTKVNNPLLTALHTGRSSAAATAMINK